MKYLFGILYVLLFAVILFLLGCFEQSLQAEAERRHYRDPLIAQVDNLFFYEAKDGSVYCKEVTIGVY